MSPKNYRNLLRILKKRGAVLVLLLAAAGTVAYAPRIKAVDGRDFAGTYSLSDVSQSGDSTTLTISMQVFNYSGADVSNATVVLEDSDQAGLTYGTFSDVSIAANDSVSLSAQATLPSDEVARWQQGSSPRVTIQFIDGDGQSHDQRVELAPGPPGQ